MKRFSADIITRNIRANHRALACGQVEELAEAYEKLAAFIEHCAAQECFCSDYVAARGTCEFCQAKALNR